MNISDFKVRFSSIVDIGEKISLLERETNDKYLKLHRGVMDVSTIDLGFIDLNLNDKETHQYSNNDGDINLIQSIKSIFGLNDHHVIICPGGMPSLDIVINSLSDEIAWIPEYHWGSWNKILETHGFRDSGDRIIRTFNEFDLESFRPIEGIVMLCYPSNPTGWMPEMSILDRFIRYCYQMDITVILDLPYYHMFFDSDSISNLFLKNVIVVSSFSKSVGLSGYRIGYVATLNYDLYGVLRTRSLYKYNSISNLPQRIINKLISTEIGQVSVSKYRNDTKDEIVKNIKYLKKNDLLWDKYPKDPIGPFCIVKNSFDELLSYKISSVPLNKFTIDSSLEMGVSRISLAVNNDRFISYFDKILDNLK